jgi:6-phosphogluconolactonase
MDTLVYVGTYSARGSEGIYVYRIDPGTGHLKHIGCWPAGKNPSYLAVDAKQRFLYAVNDFADVDGKPGGGVHAFAVDLASGALRFVNAKPSRGTGPCHLSVDATGRCVLVANYGTGSIAVLPVLPDGRLGDATGFVQHPAPAMVRERQEAPHAHSIVVDPAGAYAFVPDLGLDRIMIYALEVATGRLRVHTAPWVTLPSGAGPRHFTFHPSGCFAYVINELDNTVCSYRYLGNGTLQYVQRLTCLPDHWHGTSYGADIQVSPDGRFVYGSNRGHDSIVIFALDRASGTLTLVGHEPTRGEWPRSFAVDPTGRFVLVANEHSDSLVSFAVERRSGTLRPTGQVVAVPAPMCVKILAPPAT